MAAKARRVPQRLGPLGVAVVSTISTTTGMAVRPIKVSATKPGRLDAQLSVRAKAVRR